MSLSFDATFYQTQRPDVFDAFVATQGSTGLAWAQFAENHFNTFGWVEGSDPNANFDTSYYLNTYVDVAAAGVNPFTHFVAFGSSEGRFPTANVSTAGFDEATYLAANADVQAAVTAGTFTSGYQHWVLNGQFEGRSGAPTVDTGTGGTTGTFTALTDSLTGTSGNDVFDASLTIQGGTLFNTLNNADTVSGGAGIDTLNAQFTGATTVAPASLAGIEILNIEPTTAGVTVNTVNSDSLTTIGASNMGGAVTVSNSPTAISTVNVTNNNNNNVTVGVNATALTGTTDAVAINLDGVTNGGATAIAVNGSSATASGYEAITVNSGGGNANALNALTSTGNSFATLNVTGGQNFGITTALATTVTTFDASAATGNVSLLAGNTTGDVTFTGGTGNDSFSIIGAAGALTTTDTLNGGDGTDTLVVLEDDIDNLAASGAFSTITNFEQLNISGNIEAADIIRVDRVQTGLANVDVLGTNAGTSFFHFDATAVDIEFNNNTGGATTIIQTGTATTDTLTIDIDAAGAFAATGGFTTTGFETVTINGQDGAVTTNAITVTPSTGANSTVNFTGDQNIITGANAITAANIDASALSVSTTANGLTMGATTVAPNGASITGSAGVDILYGSTANDTISGGTGADTLFTQGGTDSLTGGAGDDTFFITGNATSTTIQTQTITDFTVGSGEDVLDLDESDLDGMLVTADAGAAAITAFDLVDGNAASVADNDAGSIQLATSGAVTSLVAGRNIVALNGSNLADAAAVETALEVGGNFEIRTATAFDDEANDTSADGILVLYTDGTDSYLAVAYNESDADSTDGFTAASLDVQNIVKYTGITDVSSFDGANFIISA